MILFAVFLLLAFLLGSVSFAYLFAKKIKGVDIRTVGSGNAGATNASRILGKPMGALILVLDILKGAVAAGVLPWLLFLLLRKFSTVPGFLETIGFGATGLLLGISAFLGHCFSPFLKFRGGKGVATALGVYLVVAPNATLLTFLVCAIMIGIFRVVSLASITGAVLLPILIIALNWRGADSPWFVLGITLALSAMVVYRHRANIQRLVKGSEKRI